MHIQTFKHLQIVSKLSIIPENIHTPSKAVVSEKLQETKRFRIMKSWGPCIYVYKKKVSFSSCPKAKDSHLWYLGAPTAQSCPTEGIGISWGWQGAGSVTCMKLNWNFQRGGHVLEKIPFV